MVWKPKRGEEKIRRNIKKCIHLRYKSFQQHAIVSLHPSPIHWLCHTSYRCSYSFIMFCGLLYSSFRDQFIYYCCWPIKIIIAMAQNIWEGTYVRTHVRTHTSRNLFAFLILSIFCDLPFMRWWFYLCAQYTHIHIFWSMARCGESYHDITNIVEPQWASRFWEMKQKWKTNDVIDTQS